ncbi:MAG TPA: CAP domain-containing protein [Ramlibacter sp.]|nr:CAP domain-containing protein [Ramlibacter sp.]
MERLLLSCLVAVSLLAGCGQDARTPAPLVRAPASAGGGPPDTSILGAGGGRMAACMVRAEEALQRINAARAAGRRCGARSMPAAPPLRWDASLLVAAEEHSLDMARHDYFEHASPSGRTVKDRASAARYPWKGLGENLMAGTSGIAETVQGWLDSPEHCENLMDAKFVDVAVACVGQHGTQYGTYWTMVLGRR